MKNNINFTFRHFNTVFDFLIGLLISYFIFKISFSDKDKYFITILMKKSEKNKI